jgi:PIN domain nuclease of toxin-antitoxin system
VRLLLDSHIVVWWWAGDPKLHEESRRMITTSECAVSVVTYWELGYKVSIGKLRIEDDLDDLIERDGFQVLDVTRRHAAEVWRLPHLHGDPFDRMLVAQARCEDLVLMTADHALGRYDVPIIRA